jgi:hypothetical protein
MHCLRDALQASAQLVDDAQERSPRISVISCGMLLPAIKHPPYRVHIPG